MQPRYQEFRSAIATHAGLWAALTAFAETPEAAALDPLRKRHLAKVLRAFRRAGADLPPAERAAVEKLRVELAKLSTTFAFTRFEEAGVFDAATGRALRATLLERGDAVDAEVMFREFMGRDPDPEALVRRNLGPAPANS